MKKILLLIISIILTLMANSQTLSVKARFAGEKIFYKIGKGPLCSEETIRAKFDALVNGLEEFVVIPTIYHRIIRNDSVINHMFFRIIKSDTRKPISKFEFVLDQDPLFDKKLPKFKLKDLTGNTFNSNELTGKPAMISFWNMSCTPCFYQFPILNQLKEMYGDKMNFIAITDENNSNNKLKKFLESQPFLFYQLENGGKYKKKLNFKRMPRNIFIDKYGIVRDVKEGLPYWNNALGSISIYNDGSFNRIIDELIKQ